MNTLSLGTLGAFRVWADASSNLWAIDVQSEDETYAVIADAYGVEWRVEDPEYALFALSVAGRRQVWAWDAARTGRLLSGWTGTVVDRLQDVRALQRSLYPDGEPGTSGADDAAYCARKVAGLARLVPEAARGLARQNVRAQQLWDAVAARGYRVDMELLARRRSEVAAARSASVARFGVDLTGDGDDVRGWLAEKGIQLHVSEGRTSLSRRKFHLASVPDHAREAWSEFRDLRVATAVEGKLSEMHRALRDGRVYPTIRAFGAATGRMTISGPALQNLPSRTHSLRPLLLADPGMTLVGLDLDHIEPSIAAALSEDPGLIAAVAPGEDVYLSLASQIWGERVERGDKRRDVAKGVLLAQLYGQSTAELAVELGVAIDEAQSIVGSLRDAYPTLMNWLAKVRSTHRTGQPVMTGHGRICAKFGIPDHAIANHVVQGTAADEFKAATIRVHERLASSGTDGRLWLPVHDELVIQVRIGQEQQALDALQSGMTSELRGVLLSGVPKVLGPTWRKT